MWELMQVEDRARLVLDCFPTLEPGKVQTIVGEWSSRNYPDTWAGEQQAMKELQDLCREASLSEAQKAQDRQRVKQLVKDKLK